ncbi:MAG: sulfotransferase [Myxococcota bacterium]
MSTHLTHLPFTLRKSDARLARHQPRPLPFWAYGPHGVHLSEVPVRAGGRRPSFILIGAAKSGTTSLHRYLDEHPEISMCPYKEPHFFSTDVIYERGIAWYEGLFADCGEAKEYGESSTSYTFGPLAAEAPKRIHQHVPDAKLVYIVREPVARMHSDVVQGLKYAQHALGGAELPESVEEMLFAYPSILHASRYIEQIERYLEVFPREQLLVVLQEDLIREPAATLARIFSFLGVDASHRVDTSARDNVTADYVRGRQDERIATLARRYLPAYDLVRTLVPDSVKQTVKSVLRRGVSKDTVIEPLSEQQRAELYEDFRSYNRRLAEFVGRDLSHWDRH